MKDNAAIDSPKANQTYRRRVPPSGLKDLAEGMEMTTFVIPTSICCTISGDVRKNVVIVSSRWQNGIFRRIQIINELAKSERKGGNDGGGK